LRDGDGGKYYERERRNNKSFHGGKLPRNIVRVMPALVAGLYKL
jgi:hypothetical protein